MLTTVKNNEQKEKEKQRIIISKQLQTIQEKLEKKRSYFIEEKNR